MYVELTQKDMNALWMWAVLSRAGEQIRWPSCVQPLLFYGLPDSKIASLPLYWKARPKPLGKGSRTQYSM